MVCPKCGKEINNIVSNTYICPFCGDNFDADGKEKDNINQVMIEMVDKYGIDLLNNVDRVNALLMDLAPYAEKERKLLIAAMKEGIVYQLLKLVNESKENQIFGVNKCVKQLVADIWITEIAAKYAVRILATTLGISLDVHTEDVRDNVFDTVDSRISKEQDLRILTKDMGLVSEDAIRYALKDCGAIGYKALAANSTIGMIELPEGITQIYPKAFCNCINLKKVVLPKSIKSIGGCAFEGCSQLEEIVIPENAIYKVIDGILIDKETKKALRAVNKDGFEMIKVVNGVQVLCKKAFDRNIVKKIVIPMSLCNIEENAFYLTMELSDFEVDSKNQCFRAIEGVLHNRKGTVLVRYPQNKGGVNYYLEDSVEEIGIQAFSCSRNLETITFASSLRTIGNKAFEYCSRIENLMLPGSVERIGDRAFQYCLSMKSIMLSRSILEIGDCAFYGCESLETISVPRNVQRIGNLAFAHCTRLKNVVIQDNVNFVGDGAFVGCKNIEISIKNNPYIETYCHSRGINFKKI